jgi:hypothetical protein
MAVKTVKRVRKDKPAEDMVPVLPITSVEEKLPVQSKSKTKVWIAGVIGILILAGIILYKTNNFPVVALVDGKLITRYEVDKELFKQGGKATIDNLVTEAIVQNELNRLGIKVSQDEINQKVETIKQGIPAGQDINQLLADRGMTMADVEKQLKLQLGVEKAVADKTAVTDAEVTKYITDNKSMMSATTEAGLKDEAKVALEQQKTQTAITSWVQGLRSKAKIWYSDNSLKVAETPAAGL